MYRFKRIHAPGFLLVESRPAHGDTHAKVFAPGTTPKNQGTLNLYLAGEFEFSIPSAGFAQRLAQGQTNLDLRIESFPAGVDAIEAAASADCWRMCLSTEKPGARWSRRIAELEAGGVLRIGPGSVAVVMLGGVDCDGAAHNAGSAIAGPAEITSQFGARLAVAVLL